MMTNEQFVEKLKLAAQSKTFYIKGCFGAPMTPGNKKRYTTNIEYNRKQADKINALSADTFGFDCVCLLKGILWGWCANANAIYGGAAYESNGVPDLSARRFAEACPDLTDDWTKPLDPGEILWMETHVGAYIGDGLAIESTAKWSHGVLISAVENFGKIEGYNSRKWFKHGHSPYIKYVQKQPFVPPVVKCFPEVYVLKQGNCGDEVKVLQTLLNFYGACIPVDGNFGAQTAAALKAFQKRNNLAVDGSAGKATWSKLINY